MRCRWLISACVVALAATLQAQVPGQPPPERPGPPGERGPRGERGERGPARLDVMAQRLADELQLTDAQRPAYDELVAKYQAEAEAAQAEQPDMRALTQQLREARQNGDEARVEELREQLREAGTGRTRIIRDFIAAVEPLLDETQLPKLEQFRERTLRRFEMGQRDAEDRNLLRRLPEELGLTPEQREQFDALVAERRQNMGQNREQWRELRPLMEELRQARENGDEQRVAELEAQIAEKRPGPPNFDELFAELEKILTPEQQAKLATLREQRPGRRGATLDVRAVLRAAKQLKLTDAQEEQLKSIIRDAQVGERQGTADAETRAKHAEEVKGQIVKILDEQQAAEFQKLLDRERRPAGQQERERPGGRGARRGPGRES